MQLVIKDISDKPVKLYQGNVLIGEIKTLLSFHDIRTQVIQNRISNAYIVFTDDQGVEHKCNIKSKTGSLDNWPNGLFDTLEKQMANLIQIRKTI